MLLRGSSRLEGSEVATPLGLGIGLSRIQAIFAAGQFANHGITSSLCANRKAIHAGAFGGPSVGQACLEANWLPAIRDCVRGRRSASPDETAARAGDFLPATTLPT
jgi:hypothetical protein